MDFYLSVFQIMTLKNRYRFQHICRLFKSGYKIKKKELLDNDILNKYLNINQEAKEQYDLNKKIIDFHYIPKKYINIVINKFKKIYI